MGRSTCEGCAHENARPVVCDRHRRRRGRLRRRRRASQRADRRRRSWRGDGCGAGLGRRVDRTPARTDDGAPAAAECPTPNDAFVEGCEPLVPACEAGLLSVSAASYDGSFGSLTAEGECQSAWPAPYLSGCTEALPEGVPDLRELWADEGHVERVEQCGDLVIIVGENYTHGGYATGDVADGVDDFRADGSCSQPH